MNACSLHVRLQVTYLEQRARVVGVLSDQLLILLDCAVVPLLVDVPLCRLENLLSIDGHLTSLEGHSWQSFLWMALADSAFPRNT